MRYGKRQPDEGWQIVERREGDVIVWYLQCQVAGLWHDVKGPYKSRNSAYEWWRRQMERQASSETF